MRTQVGRSGGRTGGIEKKDEMKCLYCGGKLVRKKVSYTVTQKGYHLIIDDVPAWVCEQCGEPLFD